MAAEMGQRHRASGKRGQTDPPVVGTRVNGQIGSPENVEYPPAGPRLLLRRSWDTGAKPLENADSV